MADATYLDLCLDASDAPRLAAFWAATLGTTAVDRGDGVHRIDPAPGAPGSTRLWVNAVPEAKTAKTRVHLDLRLPGRAGGPARPAGLADLIALGATDHGPVENGRWWAVTDPEGNEFCAFPPRAGAEVPPADVFTASPFELVVDTANPLAQAEWWAGRLGGRVVPEKDDPACWVEGAAGFPWEAFIFGWVPEPKTGKNRMHWDVRLTTGGPDAFLVAGARILAEPEGKADWWVLADPEGNEFCAHPPS